MTLPNQPSSALDVMGSDEFYRIHQAVSSAGDIFEIDSSTHAIYLGPESDVSEVQLVYFDSQAGTRKMNTASISAGGPFVNRVDSLLDQEYPSIGQQARILAYPEDIIEPAYVRPNPTQPINRQFNVIPYIDLICALKAVPAIPTVRPDRTFRYKVPVDKSNGIGSGGTTDLVIPMYGRRFASIYIITPATFPHITTVYQATLEPGVSSPARSLGSINIFSGSVPATASMVFRASDQINLDAITELFETPGPVTAYNVTGNWGPPLPKCKGLGDLLIISTQYQTGAPAAGFLVLDVIVRVSDREEG